MDIRFNSRVVIVTGAAQGIGGGIAAAFNEAGGANSTSRTSTKRACEGRRGSSARKSGVISRISATAAKVVQGRGERRPSAASMSCVLAAGGVCRGRLGDERWRSSRPIGMRSFAGECRCGAFLARSIRGAWDEEGRVGPDRDDLVRCRPAPSLTGIHAYSAAKHALIGLTRQVSGELAPFGVTVNSVAPGLILSNPDTVKQWEG